MEEGASVVFCSILDAAYTFGISRFINSSNGSWVRSRRFGAGLSSADWAARANERARACKVRPMSTGRKTAQARVGRGAELGWFMLPRRAKQPARGAGKPF